MESLRDELLNQTVKFLEICQTYILDKKINCDVYISMSSFKIQFIENILEENLEDYKKNEINFKKIKNIISRHKDIIIKHY